MRQDVAAGSNENTGSRQHNSNKNPSVIDEIARQTNNSRTRVNP